jgi:nucleotide-binding universal stress UspA family protein
METILCAIDPKESEPSVTAVAASLARILGARLELLHVVHLPPGLSPEYLAEDIIVDIRLKAAKALEARATELGGSGIDVRARVVVDLVDDGILKRARESRADLLVLGTHARRGAARVFLGSVAERIVRTAPCPIVVVPPSSGGRLSRSEILTSPVKLLAGIDHSTASDAALAWLRRFEGRARCDIRLVHLYWPPREQERLGLEPSDPFDVDPEMISVLTREIQSRVTAHFGRHDLPLRVRPLWGAEEDPLAWEAETDDADVLVVGTSQGRHSTAVAAIRGAHLPVICVPSARADRIERRLAPVRSVLVTTDFSPLGNAAVAEAYRLLLRSGGEVVLFHATEPGDFGLDPDRRSEIETCLLALVPKDMDAHGIRTRTAVVAERSAGEAIVKGIRRIGPDLVVMSSHGRSGFRRAVRGSVAEHVIRDAARPVLIVPASAEQPIESLEDRV